MCECASVVVIRRLIRKGLPLPCAITYMMAAPIVSPVVALSTYVAFRGQNPLEMTLLRMILGFLIAAGIGMLVRDIPPDKLLQPDMLEVLPIRRRTGLSMAVAGDDAAQDLAGEGLSGKLFRTVQSATADFLDVTFFFVIGAAIASTFNTAVNQSLLIPVATNPALSVVAMMVLAFALALCSSTNAFIAVSFQMFPPSAKLAFMLFGPVFDTKLFFMYGAVFRRWSVMSLGIGSSTHDRITESLASRGDAAGLERGASRLLLHGADRLLPSALLSHQCPAGGLGDAGHGLLFSLPPCCRELL